MELTLKYLLLCNYLGEKGLDSGSVVVALATGLFVCPVCPSFKELRGTRPGRTDFFSETGLSWNNKMKSQRQYSHQNLVWPGFFQVCLTLLSEARLLLSFRP